MEDRVIQFLSDFTCVPIEKIGLETTVNAELGVDGDDGEELLTAFSAEFRVDLSTLNFCYFGPEGLPLYYPFIGIVEFVKGFIDGYKGTPPALRDDIKPLPVKVLVDSAKMGFWKHDI